MQHSKHINLLVIPDLFPKDKEDVQGIFVLDYLKSVESFCNINVLVVRLVGKKGLNIERRDNITIYRYALSDKKVSPLLKPFYYIFWFLRGYQIGQEIKNHSIIHAHGTILSGTLAYLLSKKWKVPFIITEHQGPFSMISHSFWKRTWAKYIMQKSNSVLCVSEHLKNEILNSHIHPKSIQVTYNPVDTDLFQLKTKPESKNILFVGRLDEFKGALRSLKAFDKISEKFPKHTFTIVGDGQELSAIKTYIQEHKHLQHRVFLKGQLSKTEIALEMQKADCLVFPSRHESFGLVISEALSCGLPVIVGNKTAPKEFVNDSCGVLVPADDVDAIAKAMEHLVNNRSFYFPDAIRNHMINRFGFENFGNRLKHIYQGLI